MVLGIFKDLPTEGDPFPWRVGFIARLQPSKGTKALVSCNLANASLRCLGIEAHRVQVHLATPASVRLDGHPSLLAIHEHLTDV